MYVRKNFTYLAMLYAFLFIFHLYISVIISIFETQNKILNYLLWRF